MVHAQRIERLYLTDFTDLTYHVYSHSLMVKKYRSENLVICYLLSGKNLRESVDKNTILTFPSLSPILEIR